MSIIPSTTLSKGESNPLLCSSLDYFCYSFSSHHIRQFVLIISQPETLLFVLKQCKDCQRKNYARRYELSFFYIIALFKYKWSRYAMYRVHSNNSVVFLFNCMVEALPKALKYKALPSSNLEGNLKRLN